MNLIFPILLIGGGLAYLMSRDSSPSAPGGKPPRNLPPSTGNPTCDAAAKALPADVIAKVNAWLDADKAIGPTASANTEMAASFLELLASKSVEPTKSNAATLAACLRARAKDAKKPVGASGVPDLSSADCSVVLEAIAKMSPTYGPAIASKDPTQLKALADQLSLWLPTIADPTIRANVQRGIKCLNDLAASKEIGAGKGTPSTSDCLTDDAGNVLPDVGLAGLLAISPKLAASYATNATNATWLKNFATMLRNSCQTKAADEVDATAKMIASGVVI